MNAYMVLHKYTKKYKYKYYVISILVHKYINNKIIIRIY
jgi:hypothetical protein